jgi:hypothetical protein
MDLGTVQQLTAEIDSAEGEQNINQYQPEGLVFLPLDE